MATMDPGLKTAPTADLVRRVIDNVQALLDKQVTLVKQELHEDLSQVAGAAKTLGIGAGLLVVAGLCFFHFLFLGIDTLFPRWGWLAALLCAVVFGVIGAVVAKKGVGNVKVRPLARTRETLKEDAAWAKHQLTPNGKSNLSATTSAEPSPSSNGAHGAS